ncbi:(2Fe-2S)-binding protein [Streptomyces sp. NRRL S-340]|uniref:(2Fe-2S)-binding protein n=1 Tax=Streptomyces sp. NRRL S-340 TaxID=1463901 RepID=UPI000A6F0C2F|nr:(2Fe-2S)-binding protein [Streptomyces sp. NRRL S-340]
MEPDAQLTALRPLGGFFALRTGEPPRGPLPTLAQAYAQEPSGHGADPLTVRVRRVADGIRAPEPRVAASVAHQGLAARLWSVALGCAVRYGRLPDLAPDLLRWDPTGSAPDDLWLTEVRPLPAARPADGTAARTEPATLTAPDPDTATDPEAATETLTHPEADPDPEPAQEPATHREAATAPDTLTDPATATDALARAVLHAHLEPLAAALRARYRLAPGLLRGNAASALAAAARQVRGWALRDGRPATGDLAHGLAVRLLAHPALAGAGTLGATGFRRRSCCLYYRVPGGGVCGDCCFSRAPAPSPRAASG